ncbi:MAG: flavodoxin-dependent (E)-4-hydroxy-3-methylbut-2-enyl-diphosphate synthase [Candidatus Omnitrophota bacterium]
MIKRRKTRTVSVGKVKIGSDHPITIQSMAKTDTADVKAAVQEINKLENAGCEIVRVAVKDIKQAQAVGDIKKEIKIPLVADIHFDYKLALEAIKQGADKIRINPGNLIDANNINEIIDACLDKNIPIRLGINSGSLKGLSQKKKNAAKFMTDYMVKYLKCFRDRDFDAIIISMKTADVLTTIEAYRHMAKECGYPLHLGITAAGLPADGIIKSSIGIGTLLAEGIGDTIRVSLTGDAFHEISAARKILSAVNLRKFGPEIISCPTCGRCQADLISFAEELEVRIRKYEIDEPRLLGKPVVIAVMGCEVNGPGEAKGADIGIAFGKGKGAIFSKGEVVKTVDMDKAMDELMRMIRDVTR